MPIECPLNICMKKVCISRANRNDAVDLTIKMEVIVSSFFGSTDSTDTSVATEEQEFTWRIPGYRKKRKQTERGEPWTSRPFSFKNDSKTNFSLVFFPKSGNIPSAGIPLDDIHNWTSIYFYSNCLSTRKDIPVSEFRKWASACLHTFCIFRDQNYHVELSVLDAKGEPNFTKKSHLKCSALHTGQGYGRFILQSELGNPTYNLLPNDTLTIHCRIRKLKESSVVCLCPSKNLSNVRRLSRHSKIFPGRLNDETTADFNFKVKNFVIAAHKAVVGARSPVFADMFKQNMAQNIEIENMEPAVFQKMLQFIYTNDCDVGEHAEELLIAADKYDIKDLKDICEEELESELTADNEARLLAVSNQCQGKMLQNTIQFINSYVKQFAPKNESSCFFLYV